MSQIPARVAAEAAEADEALKQLAAAAAQPLNPPSDDSAPPPPESQDPPPPEPQPPAPPPPAVPVEIADELARIRQQLNTTIGRLDAANADNQILRRKLDEISAPAPAAPAAPASASLVTEKDREDYGEDMLDLIARAVRQEYGPRFTAMEQRLSTLEAKVGGLGQRLDQTQSVTTKTAQELLFDQLDEVIPGWDAVNTDPKFLDWLEGVDVVSNRKRSALLKEAYSDLDAGRIAYIFKKFKPDLGNAPPSGTPAPETPNAPVDLSTLVAPNTSAAPVPPANPPAGKVWTSAEVDKLYLDKQRGRITPAEFAKREAEYMQAMKEGRVTVSG